MFFDDPSETQVRPPMSLSLGDPARLFARLAQWLEPVRPLRHLIMPLAAVAAFGMWRNQYLMLAQFDRLVASLGFWQNLLIGMVTTNLLSRLAMGVAMARHGATSRNFGLRLAKGVIPRFFIDHREIRGLGFAAQRACYGASLAVRLALFALGAIGWIALHRGGTGLADVLLALGMGGLGSFLFVANPLWPADGYHWMAATLKRPELRAQSLRLLGMVLRLRPLPPDLGWREFWALLLFAVVSLGFTTFLILSILWAVAYALEAELQGTGVVIFCLILAAFGMFLLSLLEKRRTRPGGRRSRAAAARAGSGDAVRRGPAGADGQDETMAKGTRAAAGSRRGAARRTETPVPPTGADADDPLASVLGDETLWKEQRPVQAATAPAQLADDLNLDDILAAPAVTPLAAPNLPVDELDDILSLAFAPEPESELEADLAAAPEPFFGAAQRPPSPPVAEAPMARSRPDDRLDQVLRMGAARPTPAQSRRSRLVWLGVLLVALVVAFLPYPYEVGGDFVITPQARAEARARTDGEIIELRVAEGAWVEKDAVLAVLSNWDETRDVAVNEADAAKLEADLATMIGGARPEEVRVATEALSAAELGVSVARQDLERQEALFASGTISQKAVDDARNALALAETTREEARARLDLVAAGSRSTEIDAQRAAIARNAEELAFARLMLEYTLIRAPATGQIVSSLAEVPVGAYLAQGALFAEMEDNRVVIAQVEVPETMIQDVELSARAELRLWSAPDESLFGTVRAIAPRAEPRDFGNIIRVEVEVPNPEGRLAANMTGFGKIAAAERPVWQAFTLAIQGFLTIELWSWIP